MLGGRGEGQVGLEHSSDGIGLFDLSVVEAVLDGNFMFSFAQDYIVVSRLFFCGAQANKGVEEQVGDCFVEFYIKGEQTGVLCNHPRALFGYIAGDEVFIALPFVDVDHSIEGIVVDLDSLLSPVHHSAGVHVVQFSEILQKLLAFIVVAIFSRIQTSSFLRIFHRFVVQKFVKVFLIFKMHVMHAIGQSKLDVLYVKSSTNSFFPLCFSFSFFFSFI